MEEENTTIEQEKGIGEPVETPESSTDNQGSIEYLKSLLGQQLRIHISDGRIFVGQFKCTDKDINVILANALEFRSIQRRGASGEEMRSRFVGLIVIPGPHIKKVEHEQVERKRRT